MKKLLFSILTFSSFVSFIYGDIYVYNYNHQVDPALLKKIADENNALLESRLLINRDKFILKTIEDKNVDQFVKILNKFKLAAKIFGSLSAQEKEKYLAVLAQKINNKKDELVQPRSIEEKIKILLSSGIFAGSIILPVYCYYSLFKHGFDDNAPIATLLKIMSGIFSLPVSIVSGIFAYKFYNRTDLKQILEQFEQMEKVLKVHNS